MLLSDAERKARTDSLISRIKSVRAELNNPSFVYVNLIDGCIPSNETLDISPRDKAIGEQFDQVISTLEKDAVMGDYKAIEFRFEQMESNGGRFYRCREEVINKLKTDIKTLYMDYNKDFRQQQEKQSGCAITLAFMVVGATMYFLGGIKFFETILENISPKDSHASKVMQERSSYSNYLSR